MSIQVEKISVECRGMKGCPACKGTLYEYRDGRWREWICWRCGYYESDTPAFRAYPHLFRDIVRKNSGYFLEEYAHYGKGIAT